MILDLLDARHRGQGERKHTHDYNKNIIDLVKIVLVGIFWADTYYIDNNSRALTSILRKKKKLLTFRIESQ